MSPPLSPPLSLRLSPLFDAHCHLQDRRMGQWALRGGEGDEGEGENEENRRHRRLDAIVARARLVGVAGVACCSCSEEDWKTVAALAARYPDFVHPSFGLHPWCLEGGRKPGWEARLEALLRSLPSAGVGESGIDRAKTSKRKLPSLDVQLEALRVHARIARELRRPLTVHCVKAAGAIHETLSAFAPFSRRDPTSPSGGSGPSPLALDNTCLVLHGWQGHKEEVLRLSRLGNGVFFSLGARSLPRKEEETAGGLSHIPPSRLLIETDSPDGFEPRCLGEGLVQALAEGEGEGEGEEEKEEKKEEKEEAVGSLSNSTQQGLAAAKKNMNQESSKHHNARNAPLLNQPANVAALLPELARALGRDEGEVARACWENARSVFCGAAPPSGGGESGGG